MQMGQRHQCLSESFVWKKRVTVSRAETRVLGWVTAKGSKSSQSLYSLKRKVKCGIAVSGARINEKSFVGSI